MIEDAAEVEKLPPTVRNLKNVLSFSVVRPKSPRVSLPAFDQICIVVRDLDRALEYYTSEFGWGPWWVCESPRWEGLLHGKANPYRSKMAFALSGDVEIELIQVLEGENAHSEFLKERGEGLHHLRFPVEDVDGILRELAKDGIEPMWRRDKLVMLDTGRIGGVVFEVVPSRR